MSATTLKTKPAPLIEYVCPVCAERGMRKILARASKGAHVEVFCRSCKLRKIIVI